MDTEGVFEASAVQRRAFADLIEGLGERQLSTESLCAGWDVRTVAGHLASAASPAKGGFVLALVRSGGRPHRANDLQARRTARKPLPDIVGILRGHADSRFAPPLVGARGPLTDVLVHTGDVTVPLRLPHDPAHSHVRAALDFVTAGNPVGFVGRGTLRGLRLVADDFGWSWGEGPVAGGRGIELLMAACGRREIAAHLTGPGGRVLMHRLTD